MRRGPERMRIVAATGLAALLGAVSPARGDVEAPSVRAFMAADRAVTAFATRPAPGADLAPSGADVGPAPDAAFFGGGHGLTPFSAFIYSAILPGMGQLAQGSKTGYAFLALDAVGWTGLGVYNHKGQQGEDRYRAWVDRYYSKAQYDSVVAQIYRQYQGGLCQTPGSDSSFLCQDLASYFNLDSNTHSGHYYEDVGKLDKYIFGWVDWADTTGPGSAPDGHSDYDPATTPVSFGSPWAPGQPWPTGFPPLSSSLRAHYQDMRREANRYFNRADDFSWLLLLNRVVSAFHAAWLAKRSEGNADRSDAGSGTYLVVEPAGGAGTVHVALARKF